MATASWSFLSIFPTNFAWMFRTCIRVAFYFDHLETPLSTKLLSMGKGKRKSRQDGDEVGARTSSSRICDGILYDH